jgi:antitoxin MazE
MKARIVRIGNSRGVRLPKPLIEQAGLEEDVDLRVHGNTIVIAQRRPRRAGWARAAQELRAEDGDRMLDAPAPTRFDETGWKW